MQSATLGKRMRKAMIAWTLFSALVGWSQNQPQPTGKTTARTPLAIHIARRLRAFRIWKSMASIPLGTDLLNVAIALHLPTKNPVFLNIIWPDMKPARTRTVAYSRNQLTAQKPRKCAERRKKVIIVTVMANGICFLFRQPMEKPHDTYLCAGLVERQLAPPRKARVGWHR